MHTSSQHKHNLHLNMSASFLHPTVSSTSAVVATSSEGFVHWSKITWRRRFSSLHSWRSCCDITFFWYKAASTTRWRVGHIGSERMNFIRCAVLYSCRCWKVNWMHTSNILTSQHCCLLGAVQSIQHISCFSNNIWRLYTLHKDYPARSIQ